MFWLGLALIALAVALTVWASILPASSRDADVVWIARAAVGCALIMAGVGTALLVGVM